MRRGELTQRAIYRRAERLYRKLLRNDGEAGDATNLGSLLQSNRSTG